MKKLLLVFASLLGLSAFAAGTTTETVVVSAADLVTGNAPIKCNVTRRPDGRFSVSLNVKDPTPARGSFEGYDLRVMKKPFTAEETREKIFGAEFLAWHRPAAGRQISFVLTEQEVPLSYIVGTWYLGSDPNGKLQMRHVCFSVGALAAATLGAAPKP